MTLTTEQLALILKYVHSTGITKAQFKHVVIECFLPCLNFVHDLLLVSVSKTVTHSASLSFSSIEVI